MTRAWSVLLVLLIALLVSTAAHAHEFRPGLLRLDERPSADGSGSGSFDLRLLAPRLGANGPIPEGSLQPRVPEHCRLSGTLLECGEPGLVGELGVDGLEQHPIDVLVEVRFVDGTRLTAVLGPDDPTTTISTATIEQARGSVFVEYLGLGVEHILIGIDHLLFVLGLVLLVRTASSLWTVTAFTLAHSITLAASTLELVTLPGPPVEAGIALSIVLLARELALGHGLLEPGPALAAPGPRDTLSWRFPWLVAFAFGLLHGFGFAGALREVGLPADAIPQALLAFNVGVELGQLAVVAALLGVFAGLRALAAKLEPSAATIRVVRALPIWAMGSLAFAWTIERVAGFWP